eukprot:scaffold5745_cov96-Skeletonema_dohrnii-CCMP3373.AAC.1
MECHVRGQRWIVGLVVKDKAKPSLGGNPNTTLTSPLDSYFFEACERDSKAEHAKKKPRR